jgi:SRSO17 transposase
MPRPTPGDSTHCSTASCTCPSTRGTPTASAAGKRASPVQTLLLVAFSRWTIERMFQDSKMELGLDHFEARQYQAISRHLLLSCVSHLFLAEFHQAHREKIRA